MRDWVCGWAAARGLAPPVAEGAGWRVEVGWPQQVRRHVFARPCEELQALGDAVVEPWVFLKCCVTAEALRALLPPRWTVHARASMMVFEGPPPQAPPLPPGYRLELPAAAAAPHARILAPDGSEVADGRLAMVGAQAIFDRIATRADQRRRGLARAVMCALHALAHARGATRGLLSATVEGEALYRTLGWRVHSPYASAVIAGPEDAAPTR